MIAPFAQATIEVRMPNSADFCGLAAPALAGEVFKESIVVIDGPAAIFAGRRLSCLLGYRRSKERITIRNSARACRWFLRPGTGWNPTSGGA
jgi:hypothetical protein